MPSYEVPPEKLGDVILEDHFERRREGVAAIQRTVAVEGPRIAQEEVDATRPFPPVDRADYRRRFQAFDTPGGAVFANTAAHAAFVEGGRGPGKWPPREAIERWVRRKFRLQMSEMRRAASTATRGFRLDRGARARTIQAAADQAVRRVAFLISAKIAHRGIPGKHVMARVEARLTPLVVDAVRKARGEHA